MVTLNFLRWASALPPETLTQWAKLIVLTQVLKMAQDMIANIFMHNWYAFTMTHAHGLIYKERGLLIAKGKTIKNMDEILALLEAIWLPLKIAILHCPGH